MKVALVCLALLGAAVAQYDPNDKQAQIISQQAEVNPDGSYSNAYQTSNGISAQEQGQLKQSANPEQQAAEDAQGAFQYTAPDGSVIQLQYVANEFGFQPQGAHLPTPPPIPGAILRAIEWINAHPVAPEQPLKRFK